MCSRIVAGMAAVALSLSCSVLEDRDLCPCFMMVDLSDECNFLCESVTIGISGRDCSIERMVERDDYATPLLVRVPRTGVNVNVYDSHLDSLSSEEGLIIPLGEQCPQVYMYSNMCETSREEVVEHVTLRKNYCGVSLTFVAADAEKYSMRIEGDVCGYNADGKPMRGDFNFDPRFDRSSRCYFRLPRQLDQSLVLVIESLNGAKKRLSLGSYIVSSGYDWNKEDLDDIAVDIDYAGLEMRITVGSWTTVVEENVII